MSFVLLKRTTPSTPSMVMSSPVSPRDASPESVTMMTDVFFSRSHDLELLSIFLFRFKRAKETLSLCTVRSVDVDRRNGPMHSERVQSLDFSRAQFASLAFHSHLTNPLVEFFIAPGEDVRRTMSFDVLGETRYIFLKSRGALHLPLHTHAIERFDTFELELPLFKPPSLLPNPLKQRVVFARSR